MNHFLILLTVALITLTIVFIIYRPDLVEGVWLWVVGLAAPAIQLIKSSYQKVQSILSKHELNSKPKEHVK